MALRVDRLMNLMDQKNINQKELAELVGTTEVTISRYVNDENKSPRVEILMRIASVLGTNIEYLMDDASDIEKYEPIPDSFGERLRLLRSAEGLTQKEVADLLELTPKAVGFYELGEREPNLETLFDLSRIFKVSLDYLITGKETNCWNNAYKTSPEPDRLIEQIHAISGEIKSKQSKLVNLMKEYIKAVDGA